jgi:hypothetical protein
MKCTLALAFLSLMIPVVAAAQEKVSFPSDDTDLKGGTPSTIAGYKPAGAGPFAEEFGGSGGAPFQLEYPQTIGLRTDAVILNGVLHGGLGGTPTAQISVSEDGGEGQSVKPSEVSPPTTPQAQQQQ